LHDGYPVVLIWIIYDHLLPPNERTVCMPNTCIAN